MNAKLLNTILGIIIGGGIAYGVVIYLSVTGYAVAKLDCNRVSGNCEITDNGPFKKRTEQFPVKNLVNASLDVDYSNRVRLTGIVLSTTTGARIPVNTSYSEDEAGQQNSISIINNFIKDPQKKVLTITDDSRFSAVTRGIFWSIFVTVILVIGLLFEYRKKL